MGSLPPSKPPPARHRPGARDRLAEPNETFAVNLSAPTNASLTDGQGIGIILDDEPRMSINDVTVTEGNTGAVNATFTVSLSVAYDVAVTVHCQIPAHGTEPRPAVTTPPRRGT